MRITTLYRCLLSLPLLVPTLLLPLRQLQLSPQWLDALISLGFLSLLVGGIPYALLAAGLLWWTRRKSERQIRVAMFIAPALMVPLLGIAIVSVVALEGVPFVSDILTAWFVYSGYALAIGYFYVALACLVVWLAKRTGRVRYDGGSTCTYETQPRVRASGIVGRRTIQLAAGYLTGAVLFSSIDAAYEWFTPLVTETGESIDWCVGVGLRAGALVAVNHYCGSAGGLLAEVHLPQVFPLPFFAGAGPDSGGVAIAVWLVAIVACTIHLLLLRLRARQSRETGSSVAAGIER